MILFICVWTSDVGPLQYFNFDKVVWLKMFERFINDELVNVPKETFVLSSKEHAFQYTADELVNDKFVNVPKETLVLSSK